MNAAQRLPADQGRGTPGRWFRTAMGYHLLAASIHALLIVLSGLSFLDLWFVRLAWMFGPWRSLPLPYEVSDLTSGEALEALPALAVLAGLGLTVTIVVLHGFIFAVVTVAHKVFGWPRYWRDARPRISLMSIWATSAKRCWWVWAGGGCIWIVLTCISTGFAYTFYPIVDTGPVYFAANIGATCTVVALVTAGVVRTAVAGAVATDDHRCDRCGYPHRGLQGLRCPECGREAVAGAQVVFGLRWRLPSGLSRLRGPAFATLVTALFLAPVWLPVGIVHLPRPWLRLVPQPLRPHTLVTRYNPNSYPISMNAVCTVRRGNSIGVIEFTKRGDGFAVYESSYWSDSNDFDRQAPPDSVSSGEAPGSAGKTVDVGPWTLRLSGWGRSMLWLTLPDQTFKLEAYMRDDLPRDVRSAIGTP